VRNRATVDFGGGRLAIVQELRVADVRVLLAHLKALQSLAEVPLPDAFAELGPELQTLALENLQLPPDTALDDLSMSEILALKAAWLELHQSFLEQLGGLATLANRLPSARSTAPPSPASSAATATSGPTDGPSSASSST
jgi:hypothetical protein